MTQYYYTDGTNKFGPMSLDELKTKGLTADTLVWYEGMDNWIAASQVPELSSMFGVNVPPPVASTSNQPPQQPAFNQASAPIAPPKTWLVESILVTLFCCMPFGIVGIIHASKVESQFNVGNYEAAQKASQEAGKWTKLGFWIGMGVLVLYFIYIFIIVGTAASMNM